MESSREYYEANNIYFGPEQSALQRGWKYVGEEHMTDQDKNTMKFCTAIGGGIGASVGAYSSSNVKGAAVGGLFGLTLGTSIGAYFVYQGQGYQKWKEKAIKDLTSARFIELLEQHPTMANFKCPIGGKIIQDVVTIPGTNRIFEYNNLKKHADEALQQNKECVWIDTEDNDTRYPFSLKNVEHDFILSIELGKYTKFLLLQESQKEGLGPEIQTNLKNSIDIVRRNISAFHTKATNDLSTQQLKGKIDYLQFMALTENLNKALKPFDMEEDSPIYQFIHKFQKAVNKATGLVEKGEMNGVEFLNKISESQQVLQIKHRQAKQEQDSKVVNY